MTGGPSLILHRLLLMLKHNVEHGFVNTEGWSCCPGVNLLIVVASDRLSTSHPSSRGMSAPFVVIHKHTHTTRDFSTCCIEAGPTLEL